MTAPKSKSAEEWARGLFGQFDRLHETQESALEVAAGVFERAIAAAVEAARIDEREACAKLFPRGAHRWISDRICARTPEPTAPRLDALLADEQRAVARVAFLALLDGDVQDAISELRKLFPNEEISRQVAATLYGEPDIDGNARVPAHGEGSDDETCTECSRPGRDHGADDACPAAPAEEPAGVLLLPGEPAPAEPRVCRDPNCSTCLDEARDLAAGDFEAEIRADERRKATEACIDVAFERSAMWMRNSVRPEANKGMCQVRGFECDEVGRQIARRLEQQG